MHPKLNLHTGIFCFLLLITVPVHAQQHIIGPDSSRTILQLSGMVVDIDSLRPVPYVAIIIRNSSRGVYANFNGYYSIVVQEKDTLEYYALGYKRTQYIVPDTFLMANTLMHVQALQSDTILMKEQVIYPWPSREQFKNAFLSLKVPDTDLDRARENLSPEQMEVLATIVRMDPQMSYHNQMRMQTQRNYYAGQTPPNNLLNPIAWARFIQAARNGQLKRQ
jgi:hypothetical protein